MDQNYENNARTNELKKFCEKLFEINKKLLNAERNLITTGNKIDNEFNDFKNNLIKSVISPNHLQVRFFTLFKNFILKINYKLRNKFQKNVVSFNKENVDNQIIKDMFELYKRKANALITERIKYIQKLSNDLKEQSIMRKKNNDFIKICDKDFINPKILSISDNILFTFIRNAMGNSLLILDFLESLNNDIRSEILPKVYDIARNQYDLLYST